MKYQYFFKIDGKKRTAECNICKKVVRYSVKSKWNLKSHYSRVHKEVDIENPAAKTYGPSDNICPEVLVK